ncbi:uncharacterized protein [Salminus brasiliensis]|uniref:uncharacterized protein n=1 Tax=Salminus brasiliensis TaxID=930266 RepID=UPI003B82FE46
MEIGEGAWMCGFQKWSTASKGEGNGKSTFYFRLCNAVSLKGNSICFTWNYMMVLSLLYVFTVVFLPFKALEAVNMLQVELGGTITLKCNISLHHEVFWLRVSMEERPRLLMVAGLKSDGKISEVWNYDAAHYKGCLVDRFFGLQISHVLRSDFASYYCGILDGKRMEFEEGVHVYAKPAQPERVMNAENITGCEKDEVLSVAEKDLGTIPYTIFAAVLGAGQLGMVLAVVVVHMRTWKKKTLWGS